jgi:hypothetical protein
MIIELRNRFQRREVDLHCFVGFWRKPPPQIGFGVERHTLAIGRTTQVLHQYSVAVYRSRAARAHFNRVRV